MSVANQRGRGDVVVKRQGRLLLACFGLALSLVLSAWCVAWAEPVPPGQAATAATRFVSEEIARGAGYQRAVGALPATQIVGSARLLVDPEDKSTLGYVYELEPVGYIVVTSDTRLTPVIAFSYESDFSWDEDPNNVLLHMLRQDLSLRMDAADADALAPAAAAANKTDWGALLSPPEPSQDGGWSAPNPPGNGTVVYGPWLTTYWDQDSPYNDDCPIDPVTTDRSIVGCTATALAQILNYWQYPTSVDFDDPVPGSADYTTDTRSIFIDAGTANFTGIDYNDCSPSDAVAAALSYAAGVSVLMDYSSVESPAYMTHWPAALAGNWSPWSPPDERWGYVSADLRSYASDYSWWGSPYYTTETSFYTQLSASMTEGRPAGLWVSESGGGGGHTIVADGWQSGGRVFHLNYGWTYLANGWYTMPTGMPDYGFVEAAVVNIYPKAANYTLTTEVTGSGTVSNLPSGTSHSDGTHVLVTATPAAGSAFDHWEGDVSGSANPLRVIMDGNKTVRAVFGSASTHWSDDMESGQNWTATGLWHMTEQKSHSTTHSQWYGQEGTGNYATGGRSSGYLTSPVIDVSGTDSVTISFWHWRSVFHYDLPGFAQDQTYAQYSLDGGGWTQFWFEDSEDPSQYAWQQVLQDVTTTGVSSMQVRFGFDTVYSDYLDDYPGWFIDDFAAYSSSPDADPPTPDPMTWSSAPSASSSSAVTMTATAATDPSGVEYYFEETSGNPGGTDSGWQAGRIYTDSGLSENTAYCYRVKARDGSANQNETAWSSGSCATTPLAETSATFRVQADGTVAADGTVFADDFVSGAADIAEWVAVSSPVELGDVLEFDPSHAETYRRSSERCSSLVAGVVSTEPGVVLGSDLVASERAVLALSGIVPVKVSNEGGPIEVGDLLVTSSTPGHAMRWSGSAHCPCSLVGKAMEAMTDESGMILVLLTAH